MKTWAGGGQPGCGLPPPTTTVRIRAPQAPSTGTKKPGLSNTRLELKKKHKRWYIMKFKKFTLKTRLSSR
jgi:hypothetical protein